MAVRIRVARLTCWDGNERMVMRGGNKGDGTIAAMFFGSNQPRHSTLDDHKEFA